MGSSFTVLMTGSRKWTDRVSIEKSLTWMQKVGYATLIVGDAPGVDAIAYQTAKAMGYAVHRYEAEWDRQGPAAGPIRNHRMLDEHPEVDTVVFFHKNLTEKTGTADMVLYALQKGYLVVNGGQMYSEAVSQPLFTPHNK